MFSCFVVVVVVIVVCFWLWYVILYLNNISDGIKYKRFFFFQDGDENAIEGNGEEQQGPQKTKKVWCNNSLIYRLSSETVKLIVRIIYSLLEM